MIDVIVFYRKKNFRKIYPWFIFWGARDGGSSFARNVADGGSVKVCNMFKKQFTSVLMYSSGWYIHDITESVVTRYKLK